MSTGITPKTITQLQKMSDSEFHSVLIAMASITLPAGAASAGFFSRLARTPIAGRAIGYASGKAGQFIAAFLAGLLAQALSGDNPIAKESIIALIYETTGLELETLDADGVKRALGKLMADKINLQYGTTFEPFYPPENIVEDIKTQLMAELLAGVE